MIILNTQNNLYTIEFFSPPNDQFSASPLAVSMETPETVNFAKFPKKFKFPHKREYELTEMREEDSFLPPQPSTICKLSMRSMLWNISIGQLGVVVWLCFLPASAHLLSR